MGDRVLIRFHGTADRASPVLYLHNGAADVPAMLADFFESEPFTSRPGDVSYNFARLVAHACGECPGGLSIGVWQSTDGDIDLWMGNEQESHGDGGLVAVNVNTGEIRAEHGYLEAASEWSPFAERLKAAGFAFRPAGFAFRPATA